MSGVTAFAWSPDDDTLWWSAPLRQLHDSEAPATVQGWLDRIGAAGAGVRFALVQAATQGHAQFAAQVGTRRLRFDATAVGQCGRTLVLGVALNLASWSHGVMAQAVQAQRWASLGRLAHGVTHDYNNALTAIIGFAEMGLEDDPTGPLAGDLREIHQAATRAAALSTRLMSLSRFRPGNPIAVQPDDVLNHMHPLLGRVLPPTVQVRTALAAPDHTVALEPGTLEHVVMNLVMNAGDAMPRGGHIDIRTRLLHLTGPEDLGFETVPPGDYVQIDVADEGSGIAPEVLQNLFDPFFTTKEDGTGLGLSTVYGIVKESGGYIGVETRMGSGSTFHVVLPELTPLA